MNLFVGHSSSIFLAKENFSAIAYLLNLPEYNLLFTANFKVEVLLAAGSSNQMETLKLRFRICCN